MRAIPKMVSVAELAELLCKTEAEVEAMVGTGELPRPRGAKWRWASVDYALTRERHERSSVYFIEVGDFIKIGVSRDVPRRLLDIETHSPIAPTLVCAIPGSFDLECDLHNRFQHLRERGEWFRKEPELMEYIHSLRTGQEPDLIKLTTEGS